MNMLILQQVQQGLYGKLANDGLLMSMITDVFDQVPERAQLPYVVIGDGAITPVASDVPLGSTVRIRMRVYSKKPGRKEVLLIMNRIYGLLHHGALMLAESEVISIRVENASTSLLADGKTIEGTMDAALLVSETQVLL